VIDVVLPVLDEAAALPWVLQRMPAGFRPLVIDNGSNDNSAEIARKHGAEVFHEAQRGFGSACARGLAECVSDIVCFMDCDASLDPRELPAVIAPVLSRSAELVLGRRMPEPGAWPLHARIANRLLARTVGRRCSMQISDLGPMRAARTEELRSLNIEDRRSGWPLEMVLKAAEAGLRVSEVPVTYLKRAGRSKVTGTLRGTITATRDMGRLLA
jgi:glycosyltransferase involved in cell wall biosynthesis